MFGFTLGIVLNQVLCWQIVCAKGLLVLFICRELQDNLTTESLEGELPPLLKCILRKNPNAFRTRATYESGYMLAFWSCPYLTDEKILCRFSNFLSIYLSDLSRCLICCMYGVGML